MADQAFHEIQLSGKQLFFLFMSFVVLGVVIFLFGVSVGRDVRGPAAQTPQEATAATDTAVPAEVPPPTQTTPNDLTYAQSLQGREADPAKVTPPAPAAEAPPDQPAAAPAKTPSKAAAIQTPPAAEKTPPKAAPIQAAPKAATPPPKPAAPPATAEAAGTGYYLQVMSLSTEAAARNLVNQLKGKGYPASLITLPENTPVRFRVHVGPYTTRAEAQRVSSRLVKDGYQPLIKR